MITNTTDRPTFVDPQIVHAFHGKRVNGAVLVEMAYGVPSQEVTLSFSTEFAAWLGIVPTDERDADLDPDASYTCDECGRTGNIEDGIEGDGTECPDEECSGTVHVVQP